MHLPKQPTGFTLMELLIAIAIIGILATVILASLSASQVQSRNASVLSQMGEYQKALELHYLENGSFFPGLPNNSSARRNRRCFGDGMSDQGPSGNGDCMVTVTQGYSQANADVMNDALGVYISAIPIFQHANEYASPAYNGCISTLATPVPTSYSSCTSDDVSVFFMLEGTNLDCGKYDFVNGNWSGSGNTLCRLQLGPNT